MCRCHEPWEEDRNFYKEISISTTQNIAIESTTVSAPRSEPVRSFSSNLDGAQFWLEFGFKVIPIVPNTKVPAFKLESWLSLLSPETVSGCWGHTPAREVACVVGPDMVVFDADTPAALSALVTLEALHGVKPRMVVKTRRGIHHYFKLADGVFVKNDSHSTEQHPARIDVKASGGQVMLPPSTDKSIEVLEVQHMNALSTVDQAFIDAVFAHNGRSAPRPITNLEPVTPQEPMSPAKLQKLRALLGHIDADCGYADWVSVLMALFHETQGNQEGLELANEWSQKSDKYPGAREIQIKWDSFRAGVSNPVTIGTLIKMAKDSGADMAPIVGHSQEAFEICEMEIIDPVAAAASVVVEAPKPPVSTNPFAKYSLTDSVDEMARNLVEQKHIVGKLVLQGQAAVIYAKPNVGKTLLMLYFIMEAITQGTIEPSKIIYLNMDDNSNGLVEKLRVAREYGFEMLSDGHKDFTVDKFRPLVARMSKDGSARGHVLVLDTLTKFLDTMSKQESRAFTQEMRKFVLQGGTVVALGHANKNPNKNGEFMYAGTSDIMNDFDCAYMLEELEVSSGRRVVRFKNTKQRGPVVEEVSYSYSVAEGTTTTEKLLSIQEVDASVSMGLVLQAQMLSDEKIICAVKAAIANGINTKIKLQVEVKKVLGASRNSFARVIGKYTGTDPKNHLWTFETKAHGAMVYTLLPAASDTDVPLKACDNSVAESYVPDPIAVSELADF